MSKREETVRKRAKRKRKGEKQKDPTLGECVMQVKYKKKHSPSSIDSIRMIRTSCMYLHSHQDKEEKRHTCPSRGNFVRTETQMRPRKNRLGSQLSKYNEICFLLSLSLPLFQQNSRNEQEKNTHKERKSRMSHVCFPLAYYRNAIALQVSNIDSDIGQC